MVSGNTPTEARAIIDKAVEATAAREAGRRAADPEVQASRRRNAKLIEDWQRTVPKKKR